jgi:hypothetical protein
LKRAAIVRAAGLLVTLFPVRSPLLSAQLPQADLLIEIARLSRHIKSQP